jgi:hypothetical protein
VGVQFVGVRNSQQASALETGNTTANSWHRS